MRKLEKAVESKIKNSCYIEWTQKLDKYSKPANKGLICILQGSIFLVLS